MKEQVFVYVLDRLPYPDGEHLASRLLGNGRLVFYKQVTEKTAIIVAIGKSSETDLDVNDEIVCYINDRHATVLDFAKGDA